jgi:hypothetical protein
MNMASRHNQRRPEIPPADTSAERASIEFGESEDAVVLTLGARRDLLGEFALVPGARAWGRTGRWLVAANPTTAKRLREITGRNPGIVVSDAVHAWLSDAARWSGTLTIELLDGEPNIVAHTRSGDTPEALTHGPVPLTPASLRAVSDAITDHPDATMSGELAAARTWLASYPHADRIPAAELSVEAKRGVATLVVEPIWNAAAPTAFRARTDPMLRLHRHDDPNATVLPVDVWTAEQLAALIGEQRLAVTDEAAERLADVLRGSEERERIAALSRAHDAELEVPGPHGDLMPFQRAGVAYLLERRRAFLADEQGLGKTVQALATAQAAGAFPLVVICPASLKLNWQREARTWLPQRQTTVVDGGGRRNLVGAEIIVLNYEIVHRHIEALAALKPGMLALDEAHYVKSPQAARTKAVLELCERLPEDTMRVALTGTPIVNHPGELAPQLAAIGRLSEFGSIASFERRYSGTRTRRELHERLRSSCYVRRLKQEVLTQLPEKRRAIVTMPLDNEPAYRKAERSFIEWLREQAVDGVDQLTPALRSQAIVKLTALRRLAAEGKLAAALSWISDFVASDERLLVFAHHRSIQAAVVDQFPDCARILGTDGLAVREENVRRFQAVDGPQLCVCSMEAASHGFTLTAASDVAFLELAWTPAKHDQAEDRVHRIGQEQSVTAWYLLAADTIDERIARLLDDKRAVVDSLTDGTDAPAQALVGALLAELAAG